MNYNFLCLTFMFLSTQVMMKDISTPVPPEEFRAEMQKCLQQAALVNYTKVSKYVKIEGKSWIPPNHFDHSGKIQCLNVKMCNKIKTE